MKQILHIAACMPAGLIQMGIRTMLQGQEGLCLLVATNRYNDLLPLSYQYQPNLILFFTAPSEPDHLTLLEEFYQTIRTPVLILSLSYQQNHCYQLLDLGVQGYFLIGKDDHLLINAIHTVGAGGRWFSPTVTAQLFPTSRAVRNPLLDLTEREADVLRLMARGFSNYQICQTLNITERTVRFHVRNICDKLHLPTRSEVIVWALKDGLYR